MKTRTMTALMVVLANVLFSLSVAFAQGELDEVGVRWRWAHADPPAVEYLPWACAGVCNDTGPWIPEVDGSGERVRFACAASEPECQAAYRRVWATGATRSFTLTGIVADGRETERSDVIVVTRPVPTTTTSTTLPLIFPPTLRGVEITP